MALMHSIPKKTLKSIQNSGSSFIAKVKENQKGLLALAKEIEEASSIDSYFSHEVKQSSKIIERHIFVYNNFTIPWDEVFIKSVIRIDKRVDCGKYSTHYYVSNEVNCAEVFLEKILQEWSVERYTFIRHRSSRR